VQVVTLGEFVLIHDLKRQGLTVSAIARKLSLDRKTVRRHLERGMEPPVYGPRPPRPRQIAPYADYLRERIAAWPELTGKRLLREIRELGYGGCYSVLTDYLREVRPPRPKPFERRFETAPGRQGQVDFAQFRTAFTDQPGWSASSGSSPRSSATAAGCGAASAPPRTCRPSCAATSTPSPRWAARPRSCSTTA
jgi:transposase